MMTLFGSAARFKISLAYKINLFEAGIAGDMAR